MKFLKDFLQWLLGIALFILMLSAYTWCYSFPVEGTQHIHKERRR